MFAKFSLRPTAAENRACYEIDDGYKPVQERLARGEFEELAPFDVGMTRKLIGNHRRGAYRGLIVSQRFRRLLRELKVRATNHLPVILEA